MIITKYVNEADGFEVLVVKNDKGFGVNIFDLDAQDYVGSIVIFPEFQNAIKFAKQCVNN